MGIPGMRMDVTQAGSFQLDGGPLESIPIKSVIPVFDSVGSTPWNVGCGNDGHLVSEPTPLVTNIDYLKITVVKSDKADKLQKWFTDCTSMKDRNWDPHDINVKGYDARGKVCEEWEVKGAYPGHIEHMGYDSTSKELVSITFQLKGKSIDRVK